MASGLQRVVHITEDGSNTESRFDSLSDVPFLVLLGEPGAGKTSLLQDAERHGWGTRIACAQFFAMPDQQRAALQGKALLLDGLDEVRADPGKRDALDRLMGLAGALLPSRLWLACRAADWRHATDHTRLGWAGLPAMTPRVATLQPLSDDEVREILAEQGVTDDTAIIEHVRKHALEDLLRNPLTLKLLAEVQQKEKLPAKRGDLFETAIRHLAEEVNPEHRSHSDSRDIETLLDDAGLCCAVLLIAGLSTIDRAALGSDDSGTTLSWSLLAPRMTTRDAPGAVLDTRLFVPEALDRLRPVHRVIAEYVAARWLAKQATRGLTDRRLKALLCGPAPFPRTDLRGLHAWIACLAHTMSCRMVVRDPFGALVDADGSRLTAGAKRALLRALRDVGAEDPFFRRGDWRCEPMAPIADPALADDLRATLQERPVRGQLVSCVLDALVAGDLLPQLAPDLEALVHDPLVDGSTRLHALRALCKGDSDRLLTLYSGLSATPGLDPDFDLRAELIKTLYPDCLGTAAIAAFLTSYARQSRHQLWRFPTWLAEQVPDVALAPLLDSLADLAPGERGASDGIWRGVCAALMRLVERRLPSLSPVHAPDLVRWLAPVARNHPEARRVGGTAIQHLAPHQAWRIAMLVAVLRASGETERHRRHPWFLANCVLPRDSCGLTLTTGDAPAILGAARAECHATVAEALYWIALWLALGAKPPQPDQREAIWCAADRPEWQAARDAISVVGIERLQSEPYQQMKARRAEQQASRERDHAILRRAVASIAAGTDANLKHLACAFLGPDSRVPRGVVPEQRIARLYDDAIQDAALAGFTRCLETSELRSPAWIGDRAARERWDDPADVWLAGACVLWQQDRDRLLGLPATKQSSLIALALTHWETLQSDQEGSRWPWFDALIAAAGDRLVGILGDLLRPQLTAGVGQPRGLSQLCHETGWDAPRRALCLPLARDYPAHPDVKALLDAAARVVAGEEFLECIRQVLSAGHVLPSEARWAWLSRGWLIKPETFDTELREWVAGDAEHVGALASLVPGELGISPPASPLTDFHLITVLEFLARRAGRAEDARVGEVYSYTPEHQIRDATHRAFVQLARCATDRAEDALAGMANDPGFAAWNEINRHALATCRRTRASRESSRPDLPRLIDGLAATSRWPATPDDAQAIVLDALDALAGDMRTVGTDPWQGFWNHPHCESRTPRTENDCNQYLAELLRQRLLPNGIDVQVETAQAGRTRCDVTFSDRGWVIPVEGKRHDNREVWTGWNQQLRQRYAVDPKAGGFGIYVVYWFGLGSGRACPLSPNGTRPVTAEELQAELDAVMRRAGEARIVPVVLDVTPIPPRNGRGPKRVSTERGAIANAARRSAKQTKARQAGKRPRRASPD